MENRKQSKIFATVLQLEEHSRRMRDRLAEISGFKMAQRPTNIVRLLNSELLGLDEDVAYIKKVLNTVEAE